ncbi:MAG TPA: SDR family oxidoreductase [Acidimicrobiales bacterium]|nr:SDR family oxidoreductase [Acidimicrobiales bacterium]
METLGNGAFKHRSVLVVGGTSGIGAAVAARFAEQAAAVTVAGLQADRYQPPDPQPPGPQVTAVELDLRDGGALEALVGGLSELDVLVNCAGVIRRGGAEYEPEVFRQVLDVNLTGTMRSCVAARDLLAASSDGCIVNVASMLSFFGSPVAPAYSASKGGIVQLTRSLALGFADAGVRVNAVAPGWIHTDLTGALREDPQAEERILSRTPMGRWGRPEDVAGPVLFLASKEAAFITGAVLPVDGGYHAA